MRTLIIRRTDGSIMPWLGLGDDQADRLALRLLGYPEIASITSEPSRVLGDRLLVTAAIQAYRSNGHS